MTTQMYFLCYHGPNHDSIDLRSFTEYHAMVHDTRGNIAILPKMGAIQCSLVRKKKQATGNQPIACEKDCRGSMNYYSSTSALSFSSGFSTCFLSGFPSTNRRSSTFLLYFTLMILCSLNLLRRISSAIGSSTNF